MSEYKKVVVAGATGNLGPSIVQALVDAGFEVTTLSRTGKTDTQSRSGATGQLPSNITTIQVDYNSEESLVNALRGHDAVVCNVPKHEMQPALIDAAIKAGVKRFIPSEFGSNLAGNAKTAALPVFKNGKLAVEQHLQEVSDKISYTFVVTGAFLDWGLQNDLLLNLHGGPTTVLDGGDLKHSFTLLSDIGKAVAGVLTHPEETKNRAVYVQSAAKSQNQLLEMAKKVRPQWEPEVRHVTSEQLVKESYEKLALGGGNIMPAMIGFIIVSALGTSDYGSLWDEKNDNQLFGIEEVSDEQLEKIVAGVV